MKKILLLGSVVSPCPPLKQGGTERVAYYQAKQLALRGVQLIFVGAVGTINNFKDQLLLEGEIPEKIISNIEFIEIGGGTQYGNASDTITDDKSQIEASRKMRLESVYLAQVLRLMRERKDDYSVIFNNMRGEAVLIPLADELGKPFVNVMHLNIFPKLASIFKQYHTNIITITDHQKKAFPDLNHLDTIGNPIHTESLTLGESPENYALMLSTIGEHKNQKDAILACKKANIPLLISGKIRDNYYFEKEIKPLIDQVHVKYSEEIKFSLKVKTYANAKVFVFPILWQEPFGLVVIEALACGTPVIAYPNGGPAEIIKNGKNGYLVNSPEEMADKIMEISNIDRKFCRQDVVDRFDDKIIGQKYFEALKKFFE